jgi:flagellar basal-body rod modification protein FlgD
MTSLISPIPTAPAPTPVGQVLGKLDGTTTAGSMDLGQDVFLKLLVAQLRYQDPSSPVDGTAFVAQTAQFTQVEKLNDLVTGQRQLLESQLMLGASALVGKTVSYTPTGGGELVTGQVGSVSFAGASPTVRVGSVEVPLSSVKEVRNSTPAG